MAERLEFFVDSYGYLGDMDLEDAKMYYDIKRGNTNQAIVLCEQAIEKYFKHYIYDYLDNNADSSAKLKSHNLLQLAKYVKYPNYKEEFALLKCIYDYYWSRYLGSKLTKASWEDVDIAIKEVESVREWLINTLNEVQEDSDEDNDSVEKYEIYTESKDKKINLLNLS